MKSPPLNVPVFAGHGTTAAQSSSTFQQAQQDASTTSGSLLLAACHEAFHTEMAILPPSELARLNINLSQFQHKGSLITLPTSTSSLRHNALFSSSSLFLIQALRYLAVVEAEALRTHSITPFTDFLKTTFSRGSGILGFSSGILPACVVATSQNAITYITRCVEVYRFALWLGLRSQQYRLRVLEESALPSDSPLPWSLVFLGMSREVAENAISSFAKVNFDFLSFHPCPCLPPLHPFSSSTSLSAHTWQFRNIRLRLLFTSQQFSTKQASPSPDHQRRSRASLRSFQPDRSSLRRSTRSTIFPHIPRRCGNKSLGTLRLEGFVSRSARKYSFPFVRLSLASLSAFQTNRHRWLNWWSICFSFNKSIGTAFRNFWQRIFPRRRKFSCGISDRVRELFEISNGPSLKDRRPCSTILHHLFLRKRNKVSRASKSPSPLSEWQ